MQEGLPSQVLRRPDRLGGSGGGDAARVGFQPGVNRRAPTTRVRPRRGA